MSGIPGLGIKTPAVEGGGDALYEARKQIYPQSISGTFRNIKWGLLVSVGMLIYYFLPFVRWDRGPGQPTQAVLVDLRIARNSFSSASRSGRRKSIISPAC